MLMDDKKKTADAIFNEDEDIDVYIQEPDGDFYSERVLIVNKGTVRLLNYYKDGTYDFDGKNLKEISELIGEIKSMYLLTLILIKDEIILGRLIELLSNEPLDTKILLEDDLKACFESETDEKDGLEKVVLFSNYKEEERIKMGQTTIKMTGVKNYNTMEEESYEIECDVAFVREAFNDQSIVKDAFESEYISDDAEFVLDWLKQNNKEFKFKKLEE